MELGGDGQSCWSRCGFLVIRAVTRAPLVPVSISKTLQIVKHFLNRLLAAPLIRGLSPSNYDCRIVRDLVWAETGLPVEAATADIRGAVAGERALVLTAEPGAGKSSLVPLIVANEVAGRVVMLQPRRLAARATAQRLATLLGEPLGERVGLTIRGERNVGKDCRIEVVTEAVLTNRLQNDAELPGVGAVIFDEFHERSLHADLGLAMAVESRSLLRPDLAIVVMSATIDPAPIAALIRAPGGPAPIVSVPGRMFAVDTFHHARPSRREWTDRVAAVTRHALGESGGDALVFVPGRGEVDRVVQALSGSGVEVLGLHGGTSAEAQRTILAGGKRRRVVVATTIAETSITVPGVGIVVDGGLTRRPAFDARTGLGALETVFATQFSADQRRGRAGRLGPGACHRLWSVEDERHLADSFEPEIRTGDPLPLALALARWGDPLAVDLPLLDRPDAHRLAAGVSALAALDLVGPDGALSERGTVVGRMPIHPRFGAAIVHAPEGSLRDKVIRLLSAVEEGVRFSSADLEGASPRDLDRGRRTSRALLKQRYPPLGSTVDPLPSTLAECLLDAWPDRLAQRRAGSNPEGRFLMAVGTEVELPGYDPLAGAEFIVVVDAAGSAPRIRVRSAVAVDRQTVQDRMAGRIEHVEMVVWDDRSDRVIAEQQDRIGSIVLKSAPIREPDKALVGQALLQGVRSGGLEQLRWTADAVEILHRLRWLHSQAPGDWPDFSDAVLLDRLEEWVDLGSSARPSEIVAGRRILDLLGWQRRSELDELAPTTLTPPTGSPRPVDYSTGRPVWSVRLQHLFGLDLHPVVGPKQTPVTVELLTPANRPAQTTNDLPGFWRGSYSEVRKDLRGRYPKHDWPEDPLA